MIIGVDMDEVLSQTLESVLDHHHMTNSKLITVDQITDYYRWQILELNTSFEEAIIVMDTVLLDKHTDIMPVPGSQDTIAALKQAGHTLVVITARPKQFEQSTMEWINTHCAGVFDEVYFAAYHSADAIPKRQICHNLGVEIMIEDNHHYALDLIEHDVATILLNRPRNIGGEDPDVGLYRVDHRDQIPQLIKKLESK